MIWERIKKLFKLKPPVPTDGMIAKEQGFQLSDNPYRQHTPAHSIWRDDWLDMAGRFR